jgi:hypothetical protein
MKRAFTIDLARLSIDVIGPVRLNPDFVDHGQVLHHTLAVDTTRARAELCGVADLATVLRSL